MDSEQPAHIGDQKYHQVRAVVQSVIYKSLLDDVMDFLPRNMSKEAPEKIIEQMSNTLVKNLGQDRFLCDKWLAKSSCAEDVMLPSTSRTMEGSVSK